MNGYNRASQVKLKDLRFANMPARIKRVIENEPLMLEEDKRFDIDANDLNQHADNESSFREDEYDSAPNILSVNVDLFDRLTGKAYMIERPIRSMLAESRHSAFLAETIKLMPP